MSRRIQVNFNEVSTITAQHRAAINQAISSLESEYTQLLSSLRNMDGATNAAFVATTQQNMQKAVTTAQILERLLSFIDESARQVQIKEQTIAAKFNAR